jgi:lipopolysaccharide/colanic/teichoic acid biosynthesis glycosyltransferase
MVSPQMSVLPAHRPGARRGAINAIRDCVVGIVGSIVTVLITPMVALLIKLEDGGPVFYASEFVDCDGKVRHYFKFRTMVPNADEALAGNPELQRQFFEKHKLKHDPRILWTGRYLRKFSIDEFPQFFSLLTGDLTLVGPRTISRKETIRYGELLPKLLSVKPGITGYWQVNGRQNTTYEERIRMDMYYVENRSLRLDLIILAKTFRAVLSGEGAY